MHFLCRSKVHTHMQLWLCSRAVIAVPLLLISPLYTSCFSGVVCLNNESRVSCTDDCWIVCIDYHKWLIVLMYALFIRYFTCSAYGTWTGVATCGLCHSNISFDRLFSSSLVARRLWVEEQHILLTWLWAPSCPIWNPFLRVCSINRAPVPHSYAVIDSIQEGIFLI